MPALPRWRAILRLRSVVVAAVMTLALGTGCSSSAPAGESHHPTRALDGSAYWNADRLLEAQPFMPSHDQLPSPRALASAHTARSVGALRVGALFEHSASGNHYCTASVVDSPSQDVLITAAHCVNGGKSGRGDDTDIVFIPGYRDGREPFGVWTPAKIFAAPQWAHSSDPDFDVAFVVLQPHDGENIEQVLGANEIAPDSARRYLVHVTGYPASADAPITCVNTTARHSATQLRFDCDGYTGGTSGSPWVTDYNVASQSGKVVGVVGGYEEGGDTPSVSYSARFGPAIMQLYRDAAEASPTPATP